MTKRMLIDATHAEETRVVVLDGNRLEDFDVETSAKQQLKGNIYLAKVVRVEPSLQAAFVEYGGGRHGFLAFGEIHPDYYQIPVADRQRLLALQAEEARAEAEAEDRDAAGFSPPARPKPAGANPAGDEPEPSASEWGDQDAGPADVAHPEPAAADIADPGAEHPEPGYDAAEPVSAEPVSAQPASAQTVPPADHATDDAGLSEGGVPEEPQPSGRPAQPALMARDERFGPADAEVRETPIESLDLVPSETTLEDLPESVDRPAPVDDGFADLDVPAEDVAPPETIGGDSESSGADDARRRRESRFLRNYRIQEVIRRRQIMLIQVVKEERGTKGAALTTYISLAGRFSVLMPNSPRGGGISRKITSAADRRRLKEVTAELDLPQGMGLIVRTAGANRPKPEIRRDCEYLMRLWDDIREHTLRSVAPALVYEEASLIKRAIRDVYSRDIDEIVVDGEPGWRAAHEFMRMLMPSHAKKVQLWRGEGGQPLFAKHQVETQLDAMLSPTVQLKSGGYLVINQTEALVAIDVNSGRSTRERNIEETAFRTNLEAAEEAARQLRLRDLAGLIVIDFIDMESRKNNAAVERRLKDALRVDRARIQVGSISHFGLLEMSRQRLRPSVTETSFVACPHCNGSGHVRSTESAAIHVLREIEDEAARGRTAVAMVHAASSLVMFLLNHKRDRLSEIEVRTGMRVQFAMDESLIPPACRIDRVRARTVEDRPPPPPPALPIAPAFEPIDDTADDIEIEEDEGETAAPEAPATTAAETAEEGERRRRRRRRRRGGRRDSLEGNGEGTADTAAASESDDADDDAAPEAIAAPEAPVPEAPVSDAPMAIAPEATTAVEAQPDEQPSGPDGDAAPRRRGRRGGRRRRREDGTEAAASDEAAAEEPAAHDMRAGPLTNHPVATYTGPTPADPFGGTGFDIYDLLDTAPSDHRTATPPPPPEAPQPELPAPQLESPELESPELESPELESPELESPELESNVPEPEPAQAESAPVAAALPAEPPVDPAPPEPTPPQTTPQSEALAEPPASQPSEPVIGPAIQPVLIGEADPASERKRGWWRR